MNRCFSPYTAFDLQIEHCSKRTASLFGRISVRLVFYFVKYEEIILETWSWYGKERNRGGQGKKGGGTHGTLSYARVLLDTPHDGMSLIRLCDVDFASLTYRALLSITHQVPEACPPGRVC